MDHAHMRDIGLFLILEESFSGWPEIIKVKDRKATSVRQILRTIFARKGVPKTIVRDDALEFCDIVVKENRVYAMQNTSIQPSLKRHSGKDGPNCKDGLEDVSTFQLEYCGIHT